jgi:hypothetical protein
MWLKIQEEKLLFVLKQYLQTKDHQFYHFILVTTTKAQFVLLHMIFYLLENYSVKSFLYIMGKTNQLDFNPLSFWTQFSEKNGLFMVKDSYTFFYNLVLICRLLRD